MTDTSRFECVAEDAARYIIQAICADIAFNEILDFRLFERLKGLISTSADIEKMAVKVINVWATHRDGCAAMTYSERLRLSMLVTQHIESVII